jgi:hypothetical protein
MDFPAFRKVPTGSSRQRDGVPKRVLTTAHETRGGDVRPSRWNFPARSAERSVVDGDDSRARAPGEPGRRASWEPDPDFVTLATAGVGAEEVHRPAPAPRVEDARYLLSPAAVAAGFGAMRVGGRVRLRHACGDAVEVHPFSEPRLRWRLRTHRCGEPGSEWHIGGTQPVARSRSQSRTPSVPAHLARHGRRHKARWLRLRSGA